MELLVLGGTGWVSRALVDLALSAGHRVTAFSRGISGVPPPGADWIQGDRTNPDDLARLRKRDFDAAVDVCRQSPSQVSATARMLAGRVDRYVFFSSTSVYADLGRPGVAESAALESLPVGADEDDVNYYGALKVRCEKVVQEIFGDRALILRPCLIAGTGDPTDRFGYWPSRLAGGEEVLAPGRPDRPIQFIDIADVVQWTVRALESRLSGVYNLRGPDPQVRWTDFLAVCATVTSSDARMTWVDDDFLLAQGVVPYVDLPLWVPETDETMGFAEVSAVAAIAAGLRCRQLQLTVEDAVSWETQQGIGRERKAGLSREREASLLSAWHGR